MNLRYINLWLNPNSGYSDEYRYGFTLRTRFINHYLSIYIRKHRFVTDGTFNMISIAPMPDTLSENSMVPLDVLRVEVPFDKERYEQAVQSHNYE